MKAWGLEYQASIEGKPLILKEIPDPHPNEHQIRIKNIACGILYAAPTFMWIKTICR